MTRSEIVKQLRVQERVTQAELARRMGVNQMLISDMESGRKTIGDKMMNRVNEALNIQTHRALPDPEQETPQERIARAFALLAINRARLRSRFMP
jgi:transcriptional regulator with XRE-family HTH domain